MNLIGILRQFPGFLKQIIACGMSILYSLF